jgi:hypothetical protein
MMVEIYAMNLRYKVSHYAIVTIFIFCIILIGYPSFNIVNGYIDLMDEADDQILQLQRSTIESMTSTALSQVDSANKAFFPYERLMYLNLSKEIVSGLISGLENISEEFPSNGTDKVLDVLKDADKQLNQHDIQGARTSLQELKDALIEIEFSSN